MGERLEMNKETRDLIARELEDLHLRLKRGYATSAQAEAEIKIIQTKIDLARLAETQNGEAKHDRTNV